MVVVDFVQKPIVHLMTKHTAWSVKIDSPYPASIWRHVTLPLVFQVQYNAFLKCTYIQSWLSFFLMQMLLWYTKVVPESAESQGSFFDCQHMPWSYLMKPKESIHLSLAKKIHLRVWKSLQKSLQCFLVSLFMSRPHFLVGFVALMTYTPSNGLDVLLHFSDNKRLFRTVTNIVSVLYFAKNYKSFSQRQCLSQLWEVVCKSAKSPKKSVEIKKCSSFLILQAILTLMKSKCWKDISQCLKMT